MTRAQFIEGCLQVREISCAQKHGEIHVFAKFRRAV